MYHPKEEDGLHMSVASDWGDKGLFPSLNENDLFRIRTSRRLVWFPGIMTA